VVSDGGDESIAASLVYQHIIDYIVIIYYHTTSTMFRFAILALLFASVASLVTQSTRPRAAVKLNAKSKALPFVEAPPKLDGSMIGDFGFDPLGFTEILPSLSYVRQAELKHGRVAMLATVGFVLTQSIHLLTPESNPIKAISAIGYGPNLQILSFIGTIELATWRKTFDGEGEPGDFGFDPMNQLKGKSEAQINELKLKEIKNGRLAMVAIIGMLVQNLIFDGKPTLAF
jgi:hypothetical protein